MSGAATNNTISLDIYCFTYQPYFGHWAMTLLWTQDMADDEIIGLKSTAIKFKKH